MGMRCLKNSPLAVLRMIVEKKLYGLDRLHRCASHPCN